jgi:hypothetical protein
VQKMPDSDILRSVPAVVNFDSKEKSDRNGVIWLAEDSCDF